MRRVAAEPSGHGPMTNRRRLVPGVVSHLRNSLPRRLRFIFYVMRHQFAPAADVFGPWIRGLAHKPDVVHCNDLDTLLAGIVAKVRFGSRVVYDAHEFYPESHPAGRWLDIKLLTALERFLIRKADAVVTVNPMLAEVMREVYGLAHVYSVPNAEWWVEPGDRPPLQERHDERGARTDQGPVPGTVRRWTRDRGAHRGLEAGGWRPGGIVPARAGQCVAAVSYRTGAQAGPAGQVGLLPRSGLRGHAGRGRGRGRYRVIPYKPIIRNDRFACPNKLSQYLHAGLMVLTNDLPYVKSVVQAAGAGFSVRALPILQACRRRQSDRRRPRAPRPLPAERAEIRQAIVQLAMSRRDAERAVQGRVARDRSAARVALRSSNPFRSLRSKSSDRRLPA